MSEARKGVLAMVAATVVWGLSGLYFKALAAVPPLEMLSHRTLWSVAFLGAVLLLQRRGGELVAALGDRRLVAVLAVSAAMIAANWLLFIHAVQSGQALEASLGYYVFPLCAVALGYLVLGERFTPLQRLAIAVAAAAVAVLAVGLRAAPWLALAIAVSFSLYGLVKSRLAKGPVLTVLVETLFLAPPAAVWLWGAHAAGWHDLDGRTGGVFGRDVGDQPAARLLRPDDRRAADPLLLCSAPHSLRDGRARAVSEPDAAVCGGCRGVRRGLHRLARRRIPADLGSPCPLFVGKPQAVPGDAVSTAPRRASRSAISAGTVGCGRRKSRKLRSAKPRSTTCASSASSGSQ